MTANTGVWITFFAVVILYALVGTTTILVLRGMSRRFREAGGFADLDTPYSPGALSMASAKAEEVDGREHDGRRGAAAGRRRTRSSGAPTLARASGT